MASTVSASPIGFLSKDGKTQVKGMVWQHQKQACEVDGAPRGIVHIVHGMAEHLQRYDDFARFLAQRGFVVCGCDVIGHGKSVASAQALGCIPAKEGKDILIEDVHELRRTVAARFSRQTPYILFGHSMGSFIVRAYAARYAQGLSGIIACGSGQQPLLLSVAGNVLARCIASVKGQDYKSPLLDQLGVGVFSKKILNARTRFDWLSVDDEVVDNYASDPLCGYMFSAGGYATLTALTAQIAKRSYLQSVPSELPLLFISGALDPVGNCGKGVQAAADGLRKTGIQSVDVIMYEGLRHEILNEPDHERVYADIADWIEEHTCANHTL